MVYVDANVFVTPMVYPTTWKDVKACKAFLKRVARGGVEATTCALTWDEVVWAVRRTIDPQAGLRGGRMFLEFPELQIVPVTSAIVERAQDLAEREGLKPRDAIHAATALEAGETVVVSMDPDFDGVQGLQRKEP